jgi:hypothetical protein
MGGQVTVHLPCPRDLSEAIGVPAFFGRGLKVRRQRTRIGLTRRHQSVLPHQVVTIREPDIRLRVVRVVHHGLHKIIQRLIQIVRGALIPVVASFEIKLFGFGIVGRSRGQHHSTGPSRLRRRTQMASVDRTAPGTRMEGEWDQSDGPQSQDCNRQYSYNIPVAPTGPHRRLFARRNCGSRSETLPSRNHAQS